MQKRKKIRLHLTYVWNDNNFKRQNKTNYIVISDIVITTEGCDFELAHSAT